MIHPPGIFLARRAARKQARSDTPGPAAAQLSWSSSARNRRVFTDQELRRIHRGLAEAAIDAPIAGK
jgi:hypothetical protein